MKGINVIFIRRPLHVKGIKYPLYKETFACERYKTSSWDTHEVIASGHLIWSAVYTIKVINNDLVCSSTSGIWADISWISCFAYVPDVKCFPLELKLILGLITVSSLLFSLVLVPSFSWFKSPRSAIWILVPLCLWFYSEIGPKIFACWVDSECTSSSVNNLLVWGENSP